MMFRYFDSNNGNDCFFIKLLKKRIKEYSYKDGSMIFYKTQKKHPKIDVEYRSIVAISRYIVLKSSVLKEIQS